MKTITTKIKIASALVLVLIILSGCSMGGNEKDGVMIGEDGKEVIQLSDENSNSNVKASVEIIAPEESDPAVQ